jgi:radical SAM superfamily enzyme YgiQ (UPF0313 family)
MHNGSIELQEDTIFQHVLCVYPYRRELGRMGFLPPLGLEFIASALRPHARRLDLVDLRKEKGRTNDFLRPETDLICFSLNWEYETPFMRDEILSIPEGIFTILGGRHATEDPEGWLCSCPNVDALVRGDGEKVVEELCRGVSLDRIDGLSFRENGRITHNPNRTLGPVQNDLYPDRGRRTYKYNVTIEKVDIGIPIDLLSASRGCPFNCTFCSFSRNPWGEKRKWSVRSPESVVEELLQIDASIVGFTDDLFTHDLDRVERICDLIFKHRIRKHYVINARLEIARRPDVLRKMERAGFCMLMLGIESAHDKTLRSMRKGFTTKTIREHFDVLRHSSMILHGYFILGNIGESVEEMEEIVPFARELGVDTIAISTLRNSPFSGLDYLVESTPGFQIAPNGKIYSDEYSVQDLRLLRRKLYRRFYSSGQMLNLTRKVIGLGALGLLPRTLLHLPKVVRRTLSENLRRARRRRVKKREQSR